jgi:hypothetical protein
VKRELIIILIQIKKINNRDLARNCIRFLLCRVLFILKLGEGEREREREGERLTDLGNVFLKI